MVAWLNHLLAAWPFLLNLPQLFECTGTLATAAVIAGVFWGVRLIINVDDVVERLAEQV